MLANTEWTKSYTFQLVLHMSISNNFQHDAAYSQLRDIVHIDVCQNYPNFNK